MSKFDLDGGAEQIAVHMMKVREREADLNSEEGAALIQERAKAALKVVQAPRARLIDQALHARSRTKSVQWLRRVTDVVGVAVADSVACRRGCSACCHQGVLMSQAEASYIGKKIGLTPEVEPVNAQCFPTEIAAMIDVDLRRYSGVPCTFLREGECTIWNERPIMCRLLANFDRDSLLCEIVPGEDISVPYLDTRPEKGAYVMAVAAGMLVADIRAWFPAGRK